MSEDTFRVIAVGAAGITLHECHAPAAALPSLASKLRTAGASAVLVLATSMHAARPLHWLDSEHARGWLRASESLADAQWVADQVAHALERGFVPADALILGVLLASARPVLPQLSWGEEPFFAGPASGDGPPLDLYAIVDSAARVEQVLAAGVRTVQLRIKESGPHLQDEVTRAIAAARATAAELIINDHWQLARALGVPGVHLGQDDLQSLGEAGRQAVCASGLRVGISSHSLWELCRATALAPRYVACGPVWPTSTKDMPWLPQGLDNLAWWCRMAATPVVAIGGVLEAEQVEQAAACGADGVCLVRGLGAEPARVVPGLQAALRAGRGRFQSQPPAVDWPHPTLPHST